MDTFIGSENKYGWASITFRVATVNGTNNILNLAEQISLVKKERYPNFFGSEWIGNVDQAIPYPLQMSSINNISGVALDQTNFYDRVRSDMIST